MYEDMTYDGIMGRMLERVETQFPNLDTREGSVIWNALAPTAIELAQIYIELENILNESFVKTASREYLIRGCEQVGIDTTPFDSSKGYHLGYFNVQVNVGSRWNCDLYNYTVIDYLGTATYDGNTVYAYALECETSGSAPNNLTGTLSAITELPDGLTVSELVSCIAQGENEYDDETIRSIYFEYVNANPNDGNVAQYQRWCDEFQGVGNYKIFPCWNGANTVKVSILDTENRAVDTSGTYNLINDFQQYLDPTATSGMGDGVAPIGASVTVDTADEVTVNISATIQLASGYDLISVKSAMEQALTDYFKMIAYKKDIVSYFNIGSVMVDTEGVDLLVSVTINGDNEDIELDDEEIGVLGTLTLSEGA